MSDAQLSEFDTTGRTVTHTHEEHDAFRALRPNAKHITDGDVSCWLTQEEFATVIGV